MKLRVMLGCGLIALGSVTLAQEDPAKLCANAAKLYSDDDLDGALEEAKWCLESLEQLKQAKQSDAFPATIGGWKRGEVQSNKAMGMTVIETR